MHFDDLYDHIGQMGRLQWGIYIAIFMLNSFCMELLNLVFVGGQMEHWCRIDELSWLPPDKLKYIGIPPLTASDVGDGHVPMAYSSCERYDVNWTAYTVDELNVWNWTTQTQLLNISKTVRCKAWSYDQSVYLSTIVSKFDLVCGREFLVELTMTLGSVGLAIGTVSSGMLSDRYGRKLTLIVSLTIKAIGSFMSMFANSYTFFVISRMIAGVGSAGCFLCSIVYVMEIAGPKRRTFTGAGLQLSYSLGFMMMPIMAYFLRDEFSLQLVTMGPCVLFIPFICWMPESARWLVVKGKYLEARKVLQRFCDVNGTELPKDLNLAKIDEDGPQIKTKNCSAILKSPTMRNRAIITDFSWFCTALVYCALSLFPIQTSESTSIYLSTLINGAVEVPVNLAAIWIIDWKPLGRRWSACISLVAAGVFGFMIALMIYFGYSTAALVFSLLGKASVTFAYSAVYVFGTEIFPTEVRNVGVGVASSLECLGGITAPIIAGQMSRLWAPLPSIIYGVFSSVSGLSYIYLPETMGEPLPDTIEQADQMAAEQKRKRRKKVNAPDVDMKTSQYLASSIDVDIFIPRDSHKPANGAKASLLGEKCKPVDVLSPVLHVHNLGERSGIDEIPCTAEIVLPDPQVDAFFYYPID